MAKTAVDVGTAVGAGAGAGTLRDGDDDGSAPSAKESTGEWKA